MNLHDSAEADQKLLELRQLYEPYSHALASYLGHTLPPWIPVKKSKDNWQTSAWARTPSSARKEVVGAHLDDHF